MNLFIIDDDELFALLLKVEIEKSFPDQAFSISTFKSGEDCLRMLHLNPELALVDYHLNSLNRHAIDGIEVMEMIREQVPGCDFIMITADEHTELFLRSKAHSVYDYLMKDLNVGYRFSLSMNHWLKLKVPSA